MARMRKSPDEKRNAIREKLWPGSEQWAWDRKKSDGFTTVPRLLPWITHLLKHLASATKTGDPSPAYLELWFRSYDGGLVTIKDEEECAYAAGYSSTRAFRTWSEHMANLVNFEFILAYRDGNREFGQVLLLNPLAVAAKHHHDGKIPPHWWSSFVRRAEEIGADIPEPFYLPAGTLRQR
jgi:hypothetical protein